MSDDTVKPEIGPFPGKMGPYTAKAIEHLKDGKPGDRVNVPEMQQIMGRPCNPSGEPSEGRLGYGNVATACHRVLMDHGPFWQWERESKSWVCQNNEGRVRETHRRHRFMRKRAKKNLQVLAGADRSAMSADQRQEHSVQQVLSGTVLVATSSPTRKKLLTGDVAHFHDPPQAKLIALMQGDVPDSET